MTPNPCATRPRTPTWEGRDRPKLAKRSGCRTSCYSLGRPAAPFCASRRSRRSAHGWRTRPSWVRATAKSSPASVRRFSCRRCFWLTWLPASTCPRASLVADPHFAVGAVAAGKVVLELSWRVARLLLPADEPGLLERAPVCGRRCRVPATTSVPLALLLIPMESLLPVADQGVDEAEKRPRQGDSDRSHLHPLHDGAPLDVGWAMLAPPATRTRARRGRGRCGRGCGRGCGDAEPPRPPGGRLPTDDGGDDRRRRCGWRSLAGGGVQLGKTGHVPGGVGAARARM